MFVLGHAGQEFPNGVFVLAPEFVNHVSWHTCQCVCYRNGKQRISAQSIERKSNTGKFRSHCPLSIIEISFGGNTLSQKIVW